MARTYKLSVILLSFTALYGLLIKAALSPSLPSPSSPLILYSNQTRDDLRLVLKQSFAKASHSIDIWMYAATDPLLLQTLEKKASTGTAISLRFDPKGGTPSLPSALHPEAVKSKGLMHRKIVTIDDQVIFLGSANMTTSSLHLHDNLSVGLYHPGAALFLKAPSQKSYSFQLESSGIEGLLWLLPDLQALAAIEKQIDQAKSSIFIAMFTLTQNTLIEALLRAQKRGVTISLALDRYTAKGASKKAVKKLSEAGVEIFLSSGLPLLHHKWAYIDHSQLILGSTNWTQAAFQKNSDLLLFLNHLTSPLQREIESLISAIRIESKKAI